MGVLIVSGSSAFHNAESDFPTIGYSVTGLVGERFKVEDGYEYHPAFLYHKA